MSIRIAVDARPAAFPQKTGIGYYTWHLLRHLPQIDPETTYVAWYLNFRGIFGRGRRPLDGLVAPNLVERSTPLPARWFERLSERFDNPRIEWLVRFNVLFAPNFIPPPTRARRLVVTVHDLAFKLFPETAPQGTRWWLGRLDRALRQASRIIAVSEATRGDLIDLFDVDETRVVVVPHGVDHEVYRPPPPGIVTAIRGRFRIDRPYVMVLGGIEPRKNLARIAEAFSRLPDDLEPALVIAGGRTAWNPEGWDLLRSALDQLSPDVQRRVILTGYLREEEKVALLGGAHALIYPSLYEGFGLPVLEAMACGTPVLTSNVSALPEVSGDAAMLVDPRNTDELTDAMDRILTDDALRKRLREAGIGRAAGFQWSTTARRTAAILHEA